MNDTQSARRYARAIIETAADTRAVRDELAAVAGALASHPDLAKTFSNPGVPAASKKAIFSSVFSGLSAPLPRLFEMLIDGGRMGLVPEVVSRYRDEWNARNNVHAARVISAATLDPETSDQVKKAIESAVKGSVEMETRIDPSLVGGLKVEVDGHMFDGTVKARLKALRQHLL